MFDSPQLKKEFSPEIVTKPIMCVTITWYNNKECNKMADINESIAAVIKGMQETLDKNGFKSVNTQTDGVYAYESEKGTVKITYGDDKIFLYASDAAYADTTDDDYKRIALSLFDANSTDGDIRYIANDFSESINERFAEKKVVKRNNFKAPPTVSKTAVRSGGMSYDANTLASKICVIFPELKPYYKENIEAYGEFLPEDFFTKYANSLIVEAIRQNNPATMKKLFNALNDIYADGSNDVQDIIAVTILGSLENDKVLLANCVDYMSPIMAPVVISVNEYLASSSGKKAKKKLLNPPAYKPKKEKKKSNFMSRLGGGNQ